MPVPIEVDDLNQKAVVWLQNGIDQYGEWRVEPTPIEISVRWNDTHRVGQDAKGNPITVDAQIVAARDLPIGSVLWLGRLTDLPGTGTFEAPEEGLHQIVSYRTAKDIKGIYQRREFSASRTGNTLPLG